MKLLASKRAASKPKNVITLEKPRKYLQLKNLNFRTVMQLNCDAYSDFSTDQNAVFQPKLSLSVHLTHSVDKKQKHVENLLSNSFK